MKKYTSRRTFQNTKSIDRRFLWQYVCKKLGYSIHSNHVMSVINILLDEFLDHIFKVKIIKIGNFAKFTFQKLKDRTHINFYTGEKETSQGKYNLRVYLNKKISKFMIDQIDKEKTFKKGSDE